MSWDLAGNDITAGVIAGRLCIDSAMSNSSQKARQLKPLHTKVEIRKEHLPTVHDSEDGRTPCVL